MHREHTLPSHEVDQMVNQQVIKVYYRLNYNMYSVTQSERKNEENAEEEQKGQYSSITLAGNNVELHKQKVCYYSCKFLVL